MQSISINQLLKSFPHRELLDSIYNAAKEKEIAVFIIGGIVRDVLLKRAAQDIDLLVDTDVHHFAQLLADRSGGHVVELKEEKGTVRVVKKNKEAARNIDISKLSPHDICQSLAQRDFTINAMGLHLNKLMEKGETGLIDCYHGLQDSKNKIIRHISPESIEADPLRMVRAFRLSATLGFRLDKELVDLIKTNNELIKQSAGERISPELYHILAQPDSLAAIVEMDECGLLQQLFPEISIFKEFALKGKGKMDLWQHSMRTVRMLEMVLSNLAGYCGSHSKGIEAHISKEIAWGRARLPLLKLAALFHDLGKPETFKEYDDGTIHFIGHEELGAEKIKVIAQRLRLSRKEQDYLSQLIYYHLRPYYLFNAESLTKKAMFRFFRHAGEESIDSILLFLADSLSYVEEENLAEIERIKSFCDGLLESYFSEFLYQVKMPRLINGNEIMQTFSLEPGKLIGVLLDKVKEAQALGEISSKEEAFAMIKAFLQQKRNDTGKACS